MRLLAGNLSITLMFHEDEFVERFMTLKEIYEHGKEKAVSSTDDTRREIANVPHFLSEEEGKGTFFGTQSIKREKAAN